MVDVFGISIKLHVGYTRSNIWYFAIWGSLAGMPFGHGTATAEVP